MTGNKMFNLDELKGLGDLMETANKLMEGLSTEQKQVINQATERINSAKDIEEVNKIVEEETEKAKQYANGN